MAAFPAEARLAEGQWLKEQSNVGKAMCISRRNKNADCFEGRGTTFNANRNIYQVTMIDM
jgi:hypothetical protein